MSENFSDRECGALSDDRLFELCREFGAQALEARRKFLGLLPEVNMRRLYERRGFSSIFEFAAKLAGVSEEQVRNVLNLERKFESMPALQSMLVDGEVSVNKLVRVASIATAENQEMLAEKVRVLPNRALEVFVSDVKREENTSYAAFVERSGLVGDEGLGDAVFGYRSCTCNLKNHQSTLMSN